MGDIGDMGAVWHGVYTIQTDTVRMHGLQAVPSVTQHVVLYIQNGLIEIRFCSLTIGQRRLLPFPSLILLPLLLSSLSLSYSTHQCPGS